MKKKHTVHTLFELAILAEQEVQSLYNYFSKKFYNNKQASKFWKLLANDENKHLDFLSKCFKSLNINIHNQLIDSSIINNAEKNINIIRNINKSEVKTVTEAYLITHEIENSELNVVFKFIIGNWLKDEQESKFALNELTIHLERLKSARDESWLKSVF